MLQDPLVKSLATPDKTRTFLDGSTRQVVRLQSRFVGHGTYKPGWRWSLHVGPIMGAISTAHLGYVVSGSFRVKAADGTERDVGPGEAFEVREGHDAWVVGNEPCIALDFDDLQATD